jgi:hypothetical protein
MSSLDLQTTQGQAEQTQPGTAQAQAPLAPGQNPSMGTVPGLPPTALSMQMQSMNDQYQQAQQQQQQQQQGGGGLQSFGVGMGAMGAGTGGLGAGEFGRSSLSDMAERMAQSYGLNFGRGSLVDPEGNFAMTPDQMAAANPEMGVDDIAANMNRIAQAINDRRIDAQQNKATAALQTGMGQLQKRGRGSLAALQSNFFQSMAQNYTNPNLLPEQQDFSYWIQKGQMEEEEVELGGGAGGGAPTKSQPTAGDPTGSTDIGPQGKGDVVTSGPHAGQRPVYTYDPINQTTTITWEDV